VTLGLDVGHFLDQALDLLEGCTVLGTVFNRSTEAPVEPYYPYYGKR